MKGYVRNRYTQSVLDAMRDMEPQYVFINGDELIEVAEEISWMDLSHNDWRSPEFPKEDDERFIRFLVVSAAINFCFTDFTTDKSFDVEYPEGKIKTGASAMYASLMRAMEEGIDVLDPSVLSGLTPEVARHIFRHAGTPIPMFAERVRHLNNLGRYFKSKGTSPADMFRKNGFRALYSTGYGGITHDLARIGCYQDVSFWNGRLAMFYKRAQLVTMMYHGRALASGGALPLLEDPENIGPIADYRIPQALRHEGVIYYSEELAGWVDHGIVIEGHSQMEHELRGIGVVEAMDRLITEVNRRRPANKQIVMGQLDYPIWKMGRNVSGRHHYTYTTAY